MREIKFRAWDKVEERMLPVEAIDWRQGCISLNEGDNSVSDTFEMFELMQYAGLRKDVKGTDIYDGDIVKATRRDWDESTQILEVTFLNGCFMVGSCNAHEVYRLYSKLEVIGNRFENPELLGGADGANNKERAVGENR